MRKSRLQKFKCWGIRYPVEPILSSTWMNTSWYMSWPLCWIGGQQGSSSMMHGTHYCRRILPNAGSLPTLMVYPSHTFSYSVYSLCLSIRLGMICCAKVQIRSESFEQSFPEIQSEFRVSIRHNCLRNSMQACNFFLKRYQQPLPLCGWFSVE